MTPKEKAIELVDKYANTNGVYGASKQCAIITVDEILKSPTPKQEKYWEKVKQEIEKL